MATFKVGQRVRIVGVAVAYEVLGREAVVIGAPETRSHHITHERYTGYPLSIAGIGERDVNGIRYVFRPANLAPLTDPSADQFIERIKKLVREPITMHPDEIEEVRGGIYL